MFAIKVVICMLDIDSLHFFFIFNQKVVPAPSRTYQEAMDICAADGATLPKLLSADDTLALKHYINITTNIISFWTSLVKVNNNATIQCTDSTCDGLVEWPGGPHFAFDASVHKGLVFNSANKARTCFRFRDDLDRLADVQCTINCPVICQFTPIHVPSDYELRNGKYYKVVDFILPF